MDYFRFSQYHSHASVSVANKECVYVVFDTNLAVLLTMDAMTVFVPSKKCVCSFVASKCNKSIEYIQVMFYLIGIMILTRGYPALDYSTMLLFALNACARDCCMCKHILYHVNVYYDDCLCCVCMCVKTRV